MLCLGWFFCSISHFLGNPKTVITAHKQYSCSSVSHMWHDFCYASYTDVPSWPCFDLTLPEMGRSRQKTTLGTVLQELSVYKNPYYFFLALFPWKVSWLPLTPAPWPSQASISGLREINCSVEELEMTEVPFQPRYSTYPGLWFHNNDNPSYILIWNPQPCWCKSPKWGSLIREVFPQLASQSSYKFQAEE